MKFDRTLLSIKSSTRRFKWAITFDAKCFREKLLEKIDSYSRENERSLGIEKKMIIVYRVITGILVIVKKKKNSHNIIMFSLMQNNNYLLSPSFHLLFFFKLLVVSRFLQNERPRTNNVKINQNIIANLTDRCCEEKFPTNLFFLYILAHGAFPVRW